MSFAQKFSKKAFTVIEIVIVLALLGVVCALAIPAVSQHLTTSAQAKMQDDGLRLGIAAKAYFAETGSDEVTLKYNAKTGAITAPEEFQMPSGGNHIEKGYMIPDTLTITRDTSAAFQLKSPRGGIYTFSDKGTLTKAEENPVETR